MTQHIEKLPQSVQDEITAETLENHKQHHMPIPVYAEEMGVRADLLREHKESYAEKLNFDSTLLADLCDGVKNAMLAAEVEWIDGQKEQDAKTRFWYSNKENLYDLNHELHAKLSFNFFMNDNSHGQSVLDSIGTSDDDGDAIHDGRRFDKLLSDYSGDIEGSLFSAQELAEMKQFFSDIEEAKEAAERDRTSPNEDRILRDQIYCYMRKIETKIRKAAKACFFDNATELSRYESRYNRKNNLKQRS